MIGISTLLFDLNGFLIIPTANVAQGSDVNMARRSSTVKTLDGGVFVSDFGYSETDDELLVILTGLLEVDADKLKYMLKTHSKYRVSTVNGMFSATINSLKQVDGTITIKFFITEGIS